MRSAWSSLRPRDRCRLCPPLASTSWVLVAILLNVDGLAVDRQRRLLYGFGHGWVRMDAGADFPGGRLEQLRQGGLRDQLRSVRRHDEDAQQLGGFLVADDLDEAFGFTQDDRLRVAPQREFADLDFETLVPGLFLGEAEAGNLRIAIGCARDAIVVERFRILTGDDLHDVLALVIGDMRQQEIADDIAGGVDIRVPGAVVLVGFDVALLDLDVQLVQAEALGDALAPDRHQQPLALDRLGLVAELDADRHLAVRRLQALWLHLPTGEHLDASLREHLRQLLPNLGVFLWQQSGKELDQGDVPTVTVVDTGKLGADRAGADDHDRLRHLIQVDGVIAVDHPVAIHVEPGQRLGPRAGRHHHVLGVDHLATVLDYDLVLRLDDALALEDGDLVLLEQELGTAPDLIDDRFLPLKDGRPVDSQAIGIQAQDSGAVDLVGQLR